MDMNQLKQYAPLVLRIGIGFVFIWFGLSGLMNPQMWTGMVPAWTSVFGSPTTLVYIHGAVELIGGFLVCANYRVRPAALILFLSLLQTLTIVSWGPIFVRDIGLTLGTLAVFLQGEDE